MDEFLKQEHKPLPFLSSHNSESDDDASSTLDTDTRPPSKKKTCPPKCKYYESYPNFRFILTDLDDEPRPHV